MFDESVLTQVYSNIPHFPTPSHNGGHYTGTPFIPGAGHSNIPVYPDTSYTTHIALRSVDPLPPPEAFYHYPSGIRPGNNTPVLPGIKSWQNGKYGIMCIDVPQKDLVDTRLVPRDNKLSKYYYL